MFTRCHGAQADPRLPGVCAVLAQLRRRTRAHIHMATLSRLQPGCVISPHTGKTNRHWRIHLALKVPETANTAVIRAHDQERAWLEGEPFILDDSYEHEVSWRPPLDHVDLSPASARVVLLLDIVHPAMSPRGELVCEGYT